MIKTITKIGNSRGIIFDAALLELAHLKPGDPVNVEVHEGGTITLTPVYVRPSGRDIKQTIHRTMRDYARVMKRLG